MMPLITITCILFKNTQDVDQDLSLKLAKVKYSLMQDLKLDGGMGSPAVDKALTWLLNEHWEKGEGHLDRLLKTLVADLA